MYNSCQNLKCPPVDTSVKYSTTYTVYQHDDGQQYLVLMDYQLDLVPEDIKIYMGNLFNGNKVLGELDCCVFENTTTEISGY
jgi:predicted phage-related endonuclease